MQVTIRVRRHDCFRDWLSVLKTARLPAVSPVVCSLILGTDADADTRVIGDASIAISPGTRVADCAVRQLIGDMIAGARYKLLCTAETSGGQTPIVEVCIDCNR